MKTIEKISDFFITRPKTVLLFWATGALIVLLSALLPSLWPDKFPFLNPVSVDTDPENMLEKNEPVRVFHNQMKKEFDLKEIIVLGVTKEDEVDGVFNPETLSKVFEVVEFAKTLKWDSSKGEKQMEGVIPEDIMAFSTVDYMEQNGPGGINFEWLMPEAPENREQALQVRDRAQHVPFLNGTLVSESGKALSVYIPVSSKDQSYKVSVKLQEKINSIKGSESWYITGLPVANDTFGVQMFIQMAQSAPMAMFVIFVLMFVFFRKIRLITSPLIVAMVSVILTMGTLIVTGHTVHIMSSMIAIFIMPIAVLDSVHILSEFSDRYGVVKNKVQTLKEIMAELFMPMFYTSITSMAGFASLALTPNPPVRVFGVFVGMGVLVAWLVTISLIPATIMLIPEKSLESLHAKKGDHSGALLSRLLLSLGRWSSTRPRLVVLVTLMFMGVSIIGITKIQVNDNPIKWFESSHPIREADRVLNEHFGGTYMAYLTLIAKESKNQDISLIKKEFTQELKLWVSEQEKLGLPRVAKVGQEFLEKLNSLPIKNLGELEQSLNDIAMKQSDLADDDVYDAWDELSSWVGLYFIKNKFIFKNPDILEYIDGLQKHLLSDGGAGKVNSLSDIVKTVNRSLHEDLESEYKVPNSLSAVAECLIQFESGHRPADLYHFVTPDYKKTVLWVQLKSGDNKSMSNTVQVVKDYMAKNPPPESIEAEGKWFGLNYINIVWQDKMVSGMLKAFIGSFLVVLLLMIFLFRSAVWGMISMIPLSVTIIMIYGLVGFVGKDYDMPIAILSSLTLGLAVDFAIHFLARSRSVMKDKKSWQEAVPEMFDEPAKAIYRNTLVISIGFTPLLFAPLVPYKTVGVFMASILFFAGLSTLILLPAVNRLLSRFLFAKDEGFFSSRFNLAITVPLMVLMVGMNFMNLEGEQWKNIVGVAILLGVSIALVFPICSKLLCSLFKRKS